MSVVDRAPAWIKFARATEWGVKWKNPPVKEKLNDPETYVHHTAGNPMTNLDAFTAMRRLQEISYNLGYSTVGYDVVCHYGADGIFTVMGGREGWMSAATKDRNEEGEAICMMGYFQPGHTLSTTPDPREIEGLAWGIAWMIEQGWSAGDTKILGHRDNPKHPDATGCPGQWLYDQLPVIRNRVFSILFPAPVPPVPPTNPTPPEGEEEVLIGYVKHPNHPAVYRQWSNGTKTWIHDGDELAVHQFVAGTTPIKVNTMPNDAWTRATGVIVGPIPEGEDGNGIPL